MLDREILQYEGKGPTKVRVVCSIADAVDLSDLRDFCIMRLEKKCHLCDTYSLDGNYFNARQHGNNTALLLTELQFLHHCKPAIRMNTDRFILPTITFEEYKKHIERQFSINEGFKIVQLEGRVIIDSKAFVM